MKAITAVVLGALVGGVGVAYAEESEGEPASAEAADEDGEAPLEESPEEAADAPVEGALETLHLTLPPGRWMVNAVVAANLSSGAEFKPVSLSPDVWYGATDTLSLGLIHSGQGKTGFIGGVGDSICVTGSSNGCSKFYNSVEVDGRYQVTRGPVVVAANLGLGFRSLSPLQLAAKLGAVGRWQRGGLAIEAAPALILGLTNREAVTVGAASNKEVLALPVTALYSVKPSVAVSLQSGVLLPFEDPGRTYAVPISLGVQYRVSEPFHLTLAVSFIDLIGGSAAAGTDLRSLTVGGSYAL